MKRLAVAALMLAACDKQPSKLDEIKASRPGISTGNNAEMSAETDSALKSLDARLKAVEVAHNPTAHPGGTGDQLADRMHNVETTIIRYQEALEFLNKVYAQQKAQQEQQEASEPDPTAVFAVDISGALKAGQVEGPNSAIITIVEAWDYA
jgi:hypothetical protein